MLGFIIVLSAQCSVQSTHVVVDAVDALGELVLDLAALPEHAPRVDSPQDQLSPVLHLVLRCHRIELHLVVRQVRLVVVVVAAVLVVVMVVVVVVVVVVMRYSF